LDDNPNNALVYEDFYHDAEAFSFVVLWILKDKFITKMETALADIWATVRETDDGKGSVPNRYLTLAQAKERWSGLVLNGEEETCVDIGDYAIISQENRENSPKTYYLINEKLAEKVIEAKNDAERSKKKLTKRRDINESKQKLYAISGSICHQFVGCRYWGTCER